MTPEQRQSTVRKHAERIARSAGLRCGFDVATLIIVACAIINVAINCWRFQRETTDGETPHQRFVRLHQEKPRWIREQLRIEVERKHPELSDAERNAVVDDAIAYALRDENAKDFNALVKAET
jgi:hypothetical protein